MNVDINGENFDLQDPRMKVEAIRKWLRNKADAKSFNLPDLPEEKRTPKETPYRPLVGIPQ